MREYLETKYILGGEIGQGGMAKIYKATNRNNGKTIAVKVLKTSSDSHRNKKRFKSEINAFKKIKSPYVVTYLDSEWNENVQYIEMEYIDGYMLKDVIKKKGRLTVDEAIDFGKQISLGMDAIHNMAVIHRDIKASNIMITKTGQVKIIDLGIALHDEAERVTRTDSVIGSVQYIAPELLEKVEASVQSDIYAIGILMYEMLTGDPPFKAATSYETAMKHRDSRVPEVSKIYDNIPQSVSNIVYRATAKEPSLRHRSSYELYKDLSTSLSKERMFEKKISLSTRKKKGFMDVINSKVFMISLGILSLGILTAIIVITVIT